MYVYISRIVYLSNSVTDPFRKKKSPLNSQTLN